ncbi:hypothetical protein [Kribbella sp. NPDC049584]|uniref:hypothetical protein n=1 Tax=Kribbella sp. NPDC049584 TaxID=3154833 RepID=UPI00342F42D1
MTNHALTTEAIGSGIGVRGAEVIADTNGALERPARSGELFAPLSNVRSLGGIA